jgi:hypothetical protein
MNNDEKRLFDEKSIAIGSCYAVSLNGTKAFVKIERRISPNGQGEAGPAKWSGERVGAGDAIDQEGKKITVALEDFICLATRRDMVVQAIRLRFESDEDIHDYLQSCGVPINIKTVASYKSKYRNGTLFVKQKKPHTLEPVASSHFEAASQPDLDLDICRLAKKVGGLKSLGERVESLRRAMEVLVA